MTKCGEVENAIVPQQGAETVDVSVGRERKKFHGFTSRDGVFRSPSIGRLRQRAAPKRPFAQIEDEREVPGEPPAVGVSV